jgi:hypothetical protein
MAEEGYPSRLGKSNDFNVYGVFGRANKSLKGGTNGSKEPIHATLLEQLKRPSSSSMSGI